MEIKKNMVFEYVNTFYIKYFIPKKATNKVWYGVNLDEDFNILEMVAWSETTLNNDTNKFKLAEKTLDTIYIGSIIKYGDTFQKVLGRTGNIVFLSDSYEHLKDCQKSDECYETYTIQELKNDDWKVYQEGKEIEELTLEKVCEELGREVKIIK